MLALKVTLIHFLYCKVISSQILNSRCSLSICSVQDFPLASTCCLFKFGSMLHLVWCRTQNSAWVVILKAKPVFSRKKKLHYQMFFWNILMLKQSWKTYGYNSCVSFFLLLSLNDFRCLTHVCHSNLKYFLLPFLVTSG